MTNLLTKKAAIILILITCFFEQSNANVIEKLLEKITQPTMTVEFNNEISQYEYVKHKESGSIIKTEINPEGTFYLDGKTDEFKNNSNLFYGFSISFKSDFFGLLGSKALFCDTSILTSFSTAETAYAGQEDKLIYGEYGATADYKILFAQEIPFLIDVKTSLDIDYLRYFFVGFGIKSMNAKLTVSETIWPYAALGDDAGLTRATQKKEIISVNYNYNYCLANVNFGLTYRTDKNCNTKLFGGVKLSNILGPQFTKEPITIQYFAGFIYDLTSNDKDKKDNNKKDDDNNKESVGKG